MICEYYYILKCLYFLLCSWFVQQNKLKVERNRINIEAKLNFLDIKNRNKVNNRAIL